MKTKKIEVPKNKYQKCRWSLPDIKENGVEYICCYCERKDLENVSLNEDICEKCPYYDSKYIEYPLTINGIEKDEFEYGGGLHKSEFGKLAIVRPCGDEYKKKTYVGIFLGDLPISTYISFDKNSKMLNTRMMTNPGIFVPELNKIIFGCESWWHTINDISEIKDITDEDIDNVWYVQALKSIYSKKSEKE